MFLQKKAVVEETRDKINYKTCKKNNKMTKVIALLLVIILSVNGLHTPIKRKRFAEWLLKTGSNYKLSTRGSLSIQG